MSGCALTKALPPLVSACWSNDLEVLKESVPHCANPHSLKEIVGQGISTH